MNGLKKCQTHTLTHTHTYSHNRILFNLKKERNSATCDIWSTWRTVYWGKYAWHKEASIAWSHLCVEWNSQTQRRE